MKLKEINLEPYKMIYLLSNNPRQLFTGFRKIESIEDYWKNNDPTSLVNEYREITKEGISDFDELIRAYIILVTTTLFEPIVALETMRKLNLSLLDWGEQIKYFYENSYKSMSTITGIARAQILTPTLNNIYGASSSSTASAKRMSQKMNSGTATQFYISKRGDL